MNERPIIFNTDMVRAILDGRKTQTRRPIKLALKSRVFYSEEFEAWAETRLIFSPNLCSVEERPRVLTCRYGEPGDRLWVRETWQNLADDSGDNFVYKAELENTPFGYDDDDGNAIYLKWRPSIHMPRWASRITLEIDEIGVERVQDITEEDAMAEGFTPTKSLAGSVIVSAKRNFKATFFGIYKGANPDSQVWVIKFHRVEV